jgi:hypothetical protein
LIAVLTDPAVGGTFLTWSLHYLAGHTRYFHARSATWTDLNSDPLTNINAHGFAPNRPNTINEVYDFSKKLSCVEPLGFHSLYFHNLSDQIDHYDSLIHQPTADTIKSLLPQFSKVIILNNTHPLYNISFNARALSRKFLLTDEYNLTFEEQHNDWVNYFFKKDLAVWQEQNLTSKWDYREFLALNIRPKTVQKIITNFDCKQSHYLLDTWELYNILDQTVDQLFSFLEIDIDTTRRMNWEEIYNKWKKLHTKRLKFVWYFDTIVDYIVNGYDLDLLNFDLDLLQEATIQHSLIYKHNLNLKTFQLEKFTNTKHLHNLLEPNIHPLGNY